MEILSGRKDAHAGTARRAGTARQFSTRVFALCLVTLVCLALGACTAFRLVYGQIDHVIFLTLDRYLDVNAGYEIRLKERIARYVDWHRRTQLPAYAQILRDAAERLHGPVGKAEVVAFNERVYERLRVMALRAVPDFADLALSLTPENLRHLEKKFAESNEQFRKEHVAGSEETLRRRRFEKSLESYEDWFGRLDGTQRERLREKMQGQPLHGALRYEERLRRQRELLALLARVQKERPEAKTVEAWMRDYAYRFEHPPTTEQRAQVDAMIDTAAENIRFVIAMATPEQRAAARRRIQGYLDDIRQLTEQP